MNNVHLLCATFLLVSCKPKGSDDPVDLTEGFGELAVVDTVACSDEGFDVVTNCYNTSLPPKPSLRRSLMATSHPHWSPQETDDSTLKSYGAPKQSPQQSYSLPDHRSSVDGRIVTYSSDGIAQFVPENLDHGLQTTSDSGKAVMRRHSRMLPWTRVSPLPGQSRYPARMFTSNTATDPFNMDLCSKSGPNSNNSPRRCKARKNPGEPLRDGDCYEQTAIYSNRSTDKVSESSSVLRWELRSIDLVLFVPDGKEIATSQTDNDSIWVYPRSAVTNFMSLPDKDDYSYNDKVACRYDFTGDGQPDCDWAKVDRLKMAADEDCLGSNPEPWCAFLSDQKSIAPNANYSMPKIPSWDGTSFDDALLEPATTSDGMVMVIHGASPSDILYSYNTVGPCDASGWRVFKRLSAAHLDPNVNQKYGFAKYPIRDTQGNVIPPTQEIHGGYPWIDRKGDNLFFPLAENQDGYKVRWGEDAAFEHDGQHISVVKGDAADYEHTNSANARGIVVVGSWTQGKIVLLDNGLNLTDFKSPAYHAQKYSWDLSLYQGYNSRFRNTGASRISSLENQFNYLDAMTPISPMDVVWYVTSKGGHNAEVAFDEFLHPDALVVAPMNAPLVRHGSGTESAMFDDNGFIPHGIKQDFRFERTPKLQNTSTVQNAPSLSLRGGSWVQPVAEGGVIGKGVFLDGKNDHIAIDGLNGQDKNFYVGLWIDSRSAPGEERTVYSIGNRKYIATDLNSVIIENCETSSSCTSKSVSIGSAGISRDRYFHLGVANYGTSGVSDIYINGTLVGTIDEAIDVPNATYKAYVGVNSDAGDKQHKPLRGWIDELKIYRLNVSARQDDHEIEYFCNLALGSMKAGECDQIDVWAPRPHGDDLLDSGLDFPLAAYQESTCGNSVHRNYDSNCDRGDLLGLSDRNLVAGSPRPDFSDLPFCQSCHQNANNPVHGLRPEALHQGTLPSHADVRRQPMTWPRRLNGHTPTLGTSYTMPALELNDQLLDYQVLGETPLEGPTRVYLH